MIDSEDVRKDTIQSLLSRNSRHTDEQINVWAIQTAIFKSDQAGNTRLPHPFGQASQDKRQIAISCAKYKNEGKFTLCFAVHTLS